jgi:hypothetical protein
MWELKGLKMNEPWHNPGKWYVSPYNFAEEIVAKFNLPPGRRIVVREPSLSDEPQGVRYSIKDKNLTRPGLVRFSTTFTALHKRNSTP